MTSPSTPDVYEGDRIVMTVEDPTYGTFQIDGVVTTPGDGSAHSLWLGGWAITDENGDRFWKVLERHLPAEPEVGTRVTDKHDLIWRRDEDGWVPLERPRRGHENAHPRTWRNLQVWGPLHLVAVGEVCK